MYKIYQSVLIFLSLVTLPPDSLNNALSLPVTVYT